MPLPLGPDAAADLLRALAGYHTQAGRSPSIQELAASMGLPRTTLHHRLTVLRRQGLLRWEPGQPRTLVITPAGIRVLRAATRQATAQAAQATAQAEAGT
jgi:DNA-binding IclR family transcriptional regulator